MGGKGASDGQSVKVNEETKGLPDRVGTDAADGGEGQGGRVQDWKEELEAWKQTFTGADTANKKLVPLTGSKYEDLLAGKSQNEDGAGDKVGDKAGDKANQNQNKASDKNKTEGAFKGAKYPELNQKVFDHLAEQAAAGNIDFKELMGTFDVYRKQIGGVGLIEPAMEKFAAELNEKGIQASWMYGFKDENKLGFGHGYRFNSEVADSTNKTKEVGYLRISAGDKNATFSTDGKVTMDNGRGGQEPITDENLRILGKAVRDRLQN